MLYYERFCILNAIYSYSVSQFNRYAVMICGLYLTCSGGIRCDDVLSKVDDRDNDGDSVLEHISENSDDSVDSGDHRNSRFVVFGGDGVPEYDDVEVDVPHDYDDIDVDDDDDHDGPGIHHVWWHHFYHHGEPHLPFPLFPPVFIRPHHRVYRSCSEWPFACTNSYEVFRWLQCYYEYLGGTAGRPYADGGGGLPVVPIHAWKK